MPIRCVEEVAGSVSPARAFAAIDDLPLTASWLAPCVSLEKLAPGPNAPGDALLYRYKQGGRISEMSGKILARTPGERLHCLYSDPMFDVSVDLRVAPASSGCMMTHIIEMTPKTLFGKLMSPLIRLGVRKQTRTAAQTLRAMLEQG